jgi:hypothetical protein
MNKFNNITFVSVSFVSWSEKQRLIIDSCLTGVLGVGKSNFETIRRSIDSHLSCFSEILLKVISSVSASLLTKFSILFIF